MCFNPKPKCKILENEETPFNKFKDEDSSCWPSGGKESAEQIAFPTPTVTSSTPAFARRATASSEIEYVERDKLTQSSCPAVVKPCPPFTIANDMARRGLLLLSMTSLLIK